MIICAGKALAGQGQKNAVRKPRRSEHKEGRTPDRELQACKNLALFSGLTNAEDATTDGGKAPPGRTAAEDIRHRQNLRSGNLLVMEL